jgi:hypothetical protein
MEGPGWTLHVMLYHVQQYQGWLLSCLIERSELLENGRPCACVDGLVGLIGLLRRLMLAI